MIYDSGKARPGEVKVYSVAVANFPRNRKEFIKAEPALKIIRGLPGLVGVHPQYPKGVLLLFRTLNDAKRAKNKLDSYEILTGDNICSVFIEERYINDKEKETATSES